MAKNKSTLKTKYPKLSTLKGLMASCELTVSTLAKAIGRAPSTVSMANNGHTLYDSMDLVNIRNLINSKSKRQYGIEEIFEEIFYSKSA